MNHRTSDCLHQCSDRSASSHPDPRWKPSHRGLFARRRPPTTVNDSTLRRIRAHSQLERGDFAKGSPVSLERRANSRSQLGTDLEGTSRDGPHGQDPTTRRMKGSAPTAAHCGFLRFLGPPRQLGTTAQDPTWRAFRATGPADGAQRRDLSTGAGPRTDTSAGTARDGSPWFAAPRSRPGAGPSTARRRSIARRGLELAGRRRSIRSPTSVHGAGRAPSERTSSNPGWSAPPRAHSS